MERRRADAARVSVVVPVYMAEPWIGSTIESVRAQTLAAWEMVIVDDGSPSDQRPAVQRFLDTDSRIRFFRQPNGGADQARNAGFAQVAPGVDFVLFLDQDDLLETDALETMAGYLDANPDAGMAFCDRTIIDSENLPIDIYLGDRIPRFVPHSLWVRRLPDNHPQTPLMSFFAYNIAVPSGTMLRTSIFAATGGWDERLDFYGDDDMWVRMTLISQAHYLPRPLLRRRVHGKQLTRSPRAEARLREARAIYLHKWRSPDWLPAEQQALIRQAWRFKEGRVLPSLWFSWARERLRRRDFAEAVKCLLRGLRQLAMHGPRALDLGSA
jgi:glycosyltransferase involved in cell wall biosynthesis